MWIFLLDAAAPEPITPSNAIQGIGEGDGRGRIDLGSQQSWDEKNLDRLEAVLAENKLTVFARIDHAAGAAEAGMALRPTFLIVFGNPRGGTPLMQANQTAGIDLPLKALVWEDANGKAWVSYNDPAWLAARHKLGGETGQAILGMSAALARLAATAAE